MIYFNIDLENVLFNLDPICNTENVYVRRLTGVAFSIRPSKPLPIGSALTKLVKFVAQVKIENSFLSNKMAAWSSKCLGNYWGWGTCFTWKVVSIRRFAAFYVVFVPLEYIPTIPPHSTFVIVFVREIHRLIFTIGQSTLLAT